MINRAPVVRLKDVSKSFGKSPETVVGPISFEAHRGELLVIVGPSGCGKTTLLRLIAGLERPDSGDIILYGKTVTGPHAWAPPEDRNVGMVFQDFSLFPHLTVDGNAAFGLNPFSEAQLRHKNDLLQSLGLADLVDRYPHQLSGGEQQRVAVARALARRPDLILFDEPFSNLDADLRPRMRGQLKKVLRHLQTTSLFVTHDQTEAMELADRVVVLKAGRLEHLDTPENTYRFPKTRFVAEFVADAEFLSGTVDNGWLVTELGEFQLPPSLGDHPLLRGKNGASIDVMIRPQDVELTTTVRSEPRQGCARIVLRQFRGSEVIYTVELPSGSELRAQQQNDLPCAEGTAVEVRLRSAPALFYQGRRIG